VIMVMMTWRRLCDEFIDYENTRKGETEESKKKGDKGKKKTPYTGVYGN